MRFCYLLSIALAAAVAARPDGINTSLPPVKTSLDIKGQAVEIAVSGRIAEEGSGRVKFSLTADLGDLQKNMTALLAAQLNRSDKCGERLSVEHASLDPVDPAGPAAMLTASVHYERWGCAKAFGKEKVKRLVGGNGTVIAKLTPSIGPEGIAMAAGVQKIDADGSLGDLLRSGSLGNSIKEKIAESIQSAMRKALDLKTALPPALQAAAALQTVEFARGAEGRLNISVSGELHMPAARIQSLVDRPPSR